MLRLIILILLFVGPYVVDVNVVLFKNDVDNGAYNVDFFIVLSVLLLVR
jgi:hypothetical protein